MNAQRFAKCAFNKLAMFCANKNVLPAQLKGGQHVWC